VPEYTLGVEEEYQIVDPETRELLAREDARCKSGHSAPPWATRWYPSC
jgi:gamma-glutamyl:cysteine ligase YbdK (ATP-grasp superfamily)